MPGENIPFLIALITAVKGVLSAIWKAVSKNAALVAVWVGHIVPMLVRWFLTKRAFALALCVFLGLNVAAAFRLAFRLTQTALHHTGSLSFLNAHFKWAWWLLWDGPLNLKHVYTVVVPDLLGVWVGIVGIKYIFRKVAWLKFLASKDIKGGPV